MKNNGLWILCLALTLVLSAGLPTLVSASDDEVEQPGVHVLTLPGASGADEVLPEYESFDHFLAGQRAMCSGSCDSSGGCTCSGTLSCCLGGCIACWDHLGLL